MITMSDNIPDVIEPGEFGPAMKAISPKHRAFVIAYCTTANCDAADAARQAGYIDNKTGAIRVTAHRILHAPATLAAIREYTLARIAADAPVMHEQLKMVALNPQHKDQYKALVALMNRGGLNEVIEKNVNINITVSKEQQIAEIKAMADEMGLDANKLLGNVTDAEFEVVPEGLEKVW